MAHYVYDLQYCTMMSLVRTQGDGGKWEKGGFMAD